MQGRRRIRQPTGPACSLRSWSHQIAWNKGKWQAAHAALNIRAPTCAPDDAYLLSPLYPEGDALEDRVQVRPVPHLQTRMCAVTVQALVLHGMWTKYPVRVCHGLDLHLQGHLWQTSRVCRLLCCSALLRNPVKRYQNLQTPICICRNLFGKILGSLPLQIHMCQDILHEFQNVQDITSGCRNSMGRNAGCTCFHTFGAAPTSGSHTGGGLV